MRTALILSGALLLAACGKEDASTSGPKAPPAFAQCSSCHSVTPGKRGTGPTLAGVMGTKAGSASGFSFSPALRDSGLTWDRETMDRFLANPRGVVPGTRMTTAVRAPADRQSIIDYLEQLR